MTGCTLLISKLQSNAKIPWDWGFNSHPFPHYAAQFRCCIIHETGCWVCPQSSSAPCPVMSVPRRGCLGKRANACLPFPASSASSLFWLRLLELSVSAYTKSLQWRERGDATSSEHRRYYTEKHRGWMWLLHLLVHDPQSSLRFRVMLSLRIKSMKERQRRCSKTTGERAK